MLYYALLLAFPALVAFAGAYDLLTMTIPNRVSIALVALFLIVALLAGLSAQQILLHLACGVALLAVGILLFAVGGFGGGDAKLIAAAGLWLGPALVLPYLLYITLFGGILAVAILKFRSMPMTGVLAPEWAQRLHGRINGIPYGIAIASAALIVFPSTPVFLAALR